jgi:hypothetical protein
MVKGTSRADTKLNFRFFASLALHRYGAVSGNRSLTTHYTRPKIIAVFPDAVCSGSVNSTCLLREKKKTLHYKTQDRQFPDSFYSLVCEELADTYSAHKYINNQRQRCVCTDV